MDFKALPFFFFTESPRFGGVGGGFVLLGVKRAFELAPESAELIRSDSSQSDRVELRRETPLIAG